MNDVFKANEEWIENFEKTFKKDTEVREDFKDILNRVVKQKNITGEDFANKVHLNEKTLRRWKSGEKQPKIKSFIAFCVVYDISIEIFNYMMSALEINLTLTNKVHFAYYNLIKNYKCCLKDEKLIECNKLLDKLKIDKIHWIGNDDDREL